MLLLILAFPFIEIAFSLWMMDKIGFLESVYWVVLAFFLGLSLMRFIGLNMPQRLQTEIIQGKSGNSALLRSGLRFVAAVLLIIPGMLSDFMALGVLIFSILPGIDFLVSRIFERTFRSRVIFTNQGSQQGPFYQSYNYPEENFHPPMRDVTPLKPDELPESKNKS